MIIPTTHFRSDFSSIPLRIAKGHFATNHSHINYYIDMTYTKHRLAEARQAAKELAEDFKASTPRHVHCRGTDKRRHPEHEQT